MSTGFSFGGFGQTTPSSQPAQSTSLFGASAPKPATPSLFGAPVSSTASGSAAPATGGLFGTPATAPKPTFSFGAPATSAASSSGTGLFGSTSAAPAAPAAPPSLFGAPASAAQQQQSTSLFGGLGGSTAGQKPLFGASTQQLQQPQPQQLQQSQSVGSSSSITKASKYNELPDTIRSAIEGIDQAQISDELKSRDLGSEIAKSSSLYDQINAEATAMSNLLAQDARLANDLRARIEADLTDASKATIIVEGFKNPQAKGSAAKSVANFPYEYFARKADELRDRIRRYRASMDQIQFQVESAHGLERSPAAIVPTLKAQHSSFMALASAVAALDLQLRQLKDHYRSIWREKTGSVQDPFKVARSRDGLEKGVQRIAIQ